MPGEAVTIKITPALKVIGQVDCGLDGHDKVVLCAGDQVGLADEFPLVQPGKFIEAVACLEELS